MNAQGIETGIEDPEDNMMEMQQVTQGSMADNQAHLAKEQGQNLTIKQELAEEEGLRLTIKIEPPEPDQATPNIQVPTTMTKKRKFMTFESEGFKKRVKKNKLLQPTLNIKEEINDEV